VEESLRRTLPNSVFFAPYNHLSGKSSKVLIFISNITHTLIRTN